MLPKSLEKICRAYDIGLPLETPTPLAGGLLHQSLFLKTTLGSYVIKILNPNIIKNIAIKNKYRITEQISREFKQQGIPAITSLIQNQDCLYRIDHKTIMVFPYIEAEILDLNAVTADHAQQIAKVLTKIHQVNLSIDHPAPPEFYQMKMKEWENNCSKLSLYHTDLALQLETMLATISIIAEKNIHAQPILSKDLVISHRDLDPKNVLWDQSSQPYIIDWEAAGLINKTKDLLSTAIYWSINKQHQLNLSRLQNFLSVYNLEINKSELEPAFYSLLGDWLLWINFNLTRIINNPKNTAEYNLGIKEASNSLLGIKELLKFFPRLEKALLQ